MKCVVGQDGDGDPCHAFFVLVTAVTSDVSASAVPSADGTGRAASSATLATLSRMTASSRSSFAVEVPPVPCRCSGCGAGTGTSVLAAEATSQQVSVLRGQAHSDRTVVALSTLPRPSSMIKAPSLPGGYDVTPRYTRKHRP